MNHEKQSYFPVDPQPPVKNAERPSSAYPQSGMTESNWLLLLHLSQFAHALVPLGGIVAPLLIWQCKKDDSPRIDRHGKMVCNWILSQIIYTMIAGILAIFLIGIPLLMILAVCTIVFPVIGAINAAEGRFWNYPLTIHFIK